MLSAATMRVARPGAGRHGAAWLGVLLCLVVVAMLLSATVGGQPAAAECAVDGDIDAGSPGGAVIEGSCEDAGGGSGGTGDAGSGSGDGSGGGDDGSGTDTGGGDTGSVPRVFEPFWSTDPETGLPCIGLVGRTDVTPDSTTAIGWERRTGEMYTDPRVRDVAHRYCPTSVTSPVDPSLRARAFVRSLAVPAPDIVIAPGIAITGLPAYLEIHGQDSREVSEPIAGFGTLVVSLAAAEFTVDWGDGHVEVVDDGRRGVSWGQRNLATPISHVYTDAQPATVVRVEGSWVADWTLGTHAGRVAGITVDTEVELPVLEYIAVRLSSVR